MKKRKKIITFIVLSIFLLILLFLKFFQFNQITTNKSIYSVGEKITYTITDINFFFRCMEKNFFDNGYFVDIYKKNGDGWEYVDYPYMNRRTGNVCVNGDLLTNLSIKDRTTCCSNCYLFTNPVWGKTFTKDLLIYEYKGDEVCNYDSNTYEGKKYDGEPIPSYSYKPATPGIYKIQFLDSESIFEIK